MNMIHYFAYGSNLHPVRLSDRIESAKLIAGTQLSGYQLKFHKQGQDNSAKCNLLRTESTSDTIYGAIYTLASQHKTLLDEFEGKGCGYDDQQIEVPYGDRSIRCFTYIAQEDYIVDSLKPYHWYKQLVVQGAQYLKFPGYYVRSIQAIDSQSDPDTSRKQIHDTLLQTITHHPALETIVESIV